MQTTGISHYQVPSNLIDASKAGQDRPLKKETNPPPQRGAGCFTDLFAICCGTTKKYEGLVSTESAEQLKAAYREIKVITVDDALEYVRNMRAFGRAWSPVRCAELMKFLPDGIEQALKIAAEDPDMLAAHLSAEEREDRFMRAEHAIRERDYARAHKSDHSASIEKSMDPERVSIENSAQSSVWTERKTPLVSNQSDQLRTLDFLENEDQMVEYRQLALAPGIFRIDVPCALLCLRDRKPFEESNHTHLRKLFDKLFQGKKPLSNDEYAELRALRPE